jgi:hypothetical protein
MDNDRERKRYRVVVRGELDRSFGFLFEGMRIQQRAGNTILTGAVVDQAQLHDLIQRTRQLGLDLVSVEPADEEANGRRSWGIWPPARANAGVYLTCRACGHLHEAEALRQSLYLGQQPVSKVQATARGALGRWFARRNVVRQLTRELQQR